MILLFMMETPVCTMACATLTGWSRGHAPRHPTGWFIDVPLGTVTGWSLTCP